jgi:hypothetical protein
MFIGAAFLSHSPLVTGIKSEGKGVEYEEMLSRRVRHRTPVTEDAGLSESGLPPFSSI